MKEKYIYLSKKHLLIGAGLIVLALLALVYGFILEPYNLAVKEVVLEFDNLPAPFKGTKIVHLTDFHAGKHVKPEFYSRVVDRVLEIDPDIVVLTGDYVNWNYRFIPVLTKELSRLSPRYGMYAVLGNHDYLVEVEPIVSYLEEIPARVLINENVRIEEEGSSIWITGIDDLWFGRPDLDKTVENVPEDGFDIFLCHEPDSADRAAGKNIDLQFSGHSHGGQVRLPFIGPLILPKDAKKYNMGLYEVDDLKLYVNPGIGMMEPAVRFLCMPEITVIELK